MSEWIDDSDLPKVQSIQLGSDALCGANGDDRRTISYEIYYYKNTLTMRSETDCDTE